METTNQECCPEFRPEKWDDKTFNWDAKPFIMESIPTFLHMPLPGKITKKMMKMCDLAEAAGADIREKEDALVLFHDPSAFKSEIFYSVTGEVKNANNAPLSGDFVAKVYEGPYNSVPKHMKAMGKHLEGKGQKAKDYYIHYAYCPKCAKDYGKNYMILFAEV